MKSIGFRFLKKSVKSISQRNLYYKIRPCRFLVDASHTLPSGLNSGVQRVVRNTCKYVPLVVSDLQTEVVVSSSKGFQPVSRIKKTPLQAKVQSFKNNIVAHLPKIYVRTADLLCQQFQSAKLKSWLLPQPGHRGIFRLPIKCLDAIIPRDRTSLLADIGSKDVLLLPDAYWAHEEVWAPVVQARSNGAYVVSIVYDLIPLTHPNFVAAKAPESFRRYIKQVARYSDMIVAISNTVRDEIVQALPDLLPGEKYCTDIRSFQLGAEFSQSEAVVRPKVKEIFREDSVDCPYLMVATFDPRKNHSYLLDAFERIWQKDPTRKLCLIGRVGWLCDDVIDRITKHERYGQQLFMLNDASDGELNYCYARARAIVFPSIVEGFGLPIVEALWHGRYVFASDTAIHREVGTNECYYFDLADPMSLANQIIEWEKYQTPISPTKRSDIRPLAWQQSIECLVHQCLDGYSQRDERSAYRSKAAA